MALELTFTPTNQQSAAFTTPQWTITLKALPMQYISMFLLDVRDIPARWANRARTAVFPYFVNPVHSRWLDLMGFRV